MSHEAVASEQSPKLEAGKVGDSQYQEERNDKRRANSPHSQHRRGYQACDPCRRRKVKCNLGSVDDPHEPPCLRCRREHKDCVFSITRRKRKQPWDADSPTSNGKHVPEKRRLTISTNGSGNHESLDTAYRPSTSSIFPLNTDANYQVSPQLQRHSSQSSQHKSSTQFELDGIVELSGDHYASTIRQAQRSPRPGPSRQLAPTTPSRSKEKLANEQVLNKEAASILHPSIATSHEALHLLSVAAGQTEEAHRQNATGFVTHIRSPPTTLGTPSSTEASHRSQQAQQVLAAEISATDRSQFRGVGEQASESIDHNEHDQALRTWSKMRLVQDGWFTAVEAMAYVEYYYEHLAPMTPVVISNYRAPSRHGCLLVDEPILAIAMMTIASRYMQLDGPGGTSRAYQIHNVLWDNLRGMVQRLMWGQEQFGGSFCDGGVIKTRDSSTGQIEWKGSLRTLGTIEALLLLTDWHPRALHFPPGTNETRILDGEFAVHGNNSNGLSRAAGPEEDDKVALSSWLEPAWRSDRMSWMLLGAAVALSFELNVFDKQHYKCRQNHRPESECAKKQRVRRMVLVYVSQTSGRFGFPPMLSFEQWRSDPVFEETRTGYHEGAPDAVELMHGCWMGIARLMHKANEEIFPSKQFTRDLTSSGRYISAIARFKPMLQEWKSDYDHVRRHFRPVMQHLLSMEYDYARLYINSLGLQKVVESWINISNNEAVGPNGQAQNTEAGSAARASGAKSGGVTFSLLLEIWRPNKVYIDEVTDAARNILFAVREGLVPNGGLTHASVRSYSRILSGLMFTLKRFSFGVSEQGVREALTLLDTITDHLADSVVDDLHLSARTAELVRMLSSHLRAKFIRLQAPNNGSGGGSSGQHTRQSTPSGPPDATPSSHPRRSVEVVQDPSHQQARRQEHPQPPPQQQPLSPPQQVQHPHTQTPLYYAQHQEQSRHPSHIAFPQQNLAPYRDPLAGIQAQSMRDLSNITYMPPLNYNAYMTGNHSVGADHLDGGAATGTETGTRTVGGEINTDNNTAGDFGSTGAVDNLGDWFALPLDNFFASDTAVPVQQGFGGIGPTVGSKDMLELITNQQYDQWTRGASGNGMGTGGLG